MIEAKVQGIPDLREALRSIVPKLRKRAIRQALAAGARLVRNEARRLTPLIRAGDYAVRKGLRRRGTVQKAISVRTSKLATRRGDVGVFVNVRPAKKGARGAKSPTDPFYWRWIEFGWNPARGSDGAGKAGRRFRRRLNASGAAKRVPGARFLQRSASMLGRALEVFIREIGPRIAKLNRGKGAEP